MKNSKDNKERINKVVRYIEQSLDKDLLLEELAALACFSPFHFQRIFKEIIGETPKQFIKRLRLEDAAHMIVLYPEKSILEVALKVGFQSLEAFSRAFKDYYLLSPDNFRKSDEKEKVKIIQKPILQGVIFNEPSSFLGKSMDISEFEDLEINVVKRPVQKFIYLQTSLENPQHISESYKKVKTWALARELVKPDALLFGVIKDFPLFTSLDKCRYLTCISVESQPVVSGMVNYQELPSKTYATFELEGGMAEIIRAATYCVHFWLPNNGFKIVHQPVIEVPLKDPLTTPFNNNIYRIFIQIEPE